jgi:hypothetical protein
MAHRAFRPVHAPFFGAAGSAFATKDKPMIAVLIAIPRSIHVPLPVPPQFANENM